MLEISAFKSEPSGTVMNLLSVFCAISFSLLGALRVYVLVCFDQYVLRVCILANDGFFLYSMVEDVLKFCTFLGFASL